MSDETWDHLFTDPLPVPVDTAWLDDLARYNVVTDPTFVLIDDSSTRFPMIFDVRG